MQKYDTIFESRKTSKFPVVSGTSTNLYYRFRKYGGLMWQDPDCKTHTKYFLSDGETMKWFRLTKTNGGWALLAYDQFYDRNASKEEKDSHMEPWAITEDLIGCIEEYYSVLHPNSDVTVITKKDYEETSITES